VERLLLALLAGVLGGAAGAVALDLVRGRADRGPAGAASASDLSAGPWREIDERLARIERSLATPATVPGALAGRAAERGAEADAALAGAAGVPADPATEAHLRRIEERVEAAAERALAKAGERAEKPGPAEPPKRRAPLAEVAAEVGLSRDEEAEIRRIYDETGEKFLKLLADPDGDVEAVKRDLEAASKSDRGRGVIMMKYLPKMLPKLGDVLAVQAERETRIADVLGPERAERYDRFDVVEGDPFGFGGNLRMEARGR
jgi:hypothetical protein